MFPDQYVSFQHVIRNLHARLGQNDQPVRGIDGEVDIAVCMGREIAVWIGRR